jgi:hypothetical protein
MMLDHHGLRWQARNFKTTWLRDQTFALQYRLPLLSRDTRSDFEVTSRTSVNLPTSEVLVAANILRKQSRKSNKGWSTSVWVFDIGLEVLNCEIFCFKNHKCVGILWAGFKKITEVCKIMLRWILRRQVMRLESGRSYGWRLCRMEGFWLTVLKLRVLVPEISFRMFCVIYLSFSLTLWVQYNSGNVGRRFRTYKWHSLSFWLLIVSLVFLTSCTMGTGGPFPGG